MSINIHPRYIKQLIGHRKEKILFEDSFFNNTLQHCWLLEGVPGIGKASFAYCAARSILSLNKLQNNDLLLFNGIEDIKEINSLNFIYDNNNLIHNRISENTHSDLKIIEQTQEEKSYEIKELIPVDKVREIESFFSKTSGEGGWRIAIIDSLDNLNKHGSNALLKILEEPPKKCLIFLISHNKSNVLDTIRSRSRVLKFSELNNEDTKFVIEKSTIIKNEEEMKKINILAGGSPGKAIILFNNNGLDIYDKIIETFNSIPELDSRIIDPLLKEISDKKNVFGLKIISILITIYLNRAYKRSLKLIKLNISNDEKISQDNFLKFFNIADIPSLWENISTNINLSLNFNLDKKQAIINLLENIKKFNKNYKLLEENK